MQEARVRSLGQKDPLEKEMATHSSILAWKIPWTEELGRLQFMGLQRVTQDWATEQQQKLLKPHSSQSDSSVIKLIFRLKHMQGRYVKGCRC